MIQYVDSEVVVHFVEVEGTGHTVTNDMIS